MGRILRWGLPELSEWTLTLNSTLLHGALIFIFYTRPSKVTLIKALTTSTRNLDLNLKVMIDLHSFPM